MRPFLIFLLRSITFSQAAREGFDARTAFFLQVEKFRVSKMKQFRERALQGFSRSQAARSVAIARRRLFGQSWRRLRRVRSLKQRLNASTQHLFSLCFWLHWLTCATRFNFTSCYMSRVRRAYLGSVRSRRRPPRIRLSNARSPPPSWSQPATASAPGLESSASEVRLCAQPPSIG